MFAIGKTLQYMGWKLTAYKLKGSFRITSTGD